jgi:hypothetical protein
MHGVADVMAGWESVGLGSFIFLKRPELACLAALSLRLGDLTASDQSGAATNK